MSSSVVELAKITSSEEKESGATPASTEVPTKTTSVRDGTSAPNSTPGGTTATSSSMETTSTEKMHSTRTSGETMISSLVAMAKHQKRRKFMAAMAMTK